MLKLSLRERRHLAQKKWATANPDKIRNKYYRKDYGITLVQYEVWLAEQKGLCAICHRPEKAMFKGKVKPLAVDHCHKTGKIRGLLCEQCNHGLGRFEDSVDSLNSAILYLQSEAVADRWLAKKEDEKAAPKGD